MHRSISFWQTRTLYLASVVLAVLSGLAQSESLVFPPYLHSYGIRKATPKHLFMFFGPRTFFDNPQGLATTRLESWDDPKTDKDDDEVVVYGINSGRHEIVYNTSMWSLALYGEKGSGKGNLFFPKGVAATELGDVFVADSGNNRIVHLFNPKSGLAWRKAFNGATSNDPGLCGPSRVALDASGRIYVADPGNRRIVVFDTSGRVVQRIPPAMTGAFFENGPTALAIADGREKWSYFRDERLILCADRGGRRLWKLGFDGSVISKVDLAGNYRASFGAVDYYHSFWITDTYNHRVIKLDHNLKVLDILGSQGTGDNQFSEPRGITIYKRYGQTFIAEKKGAQYFWVGTHLNSAKIQNGQSGEQILNVEATEYSYVSLFRNAGPADTLFVFRREIAHPGGFPIYIHDTKKVKNFSGLILKIEPTYSSYTYNAWQFRSDTKGVFR